MRNSRAPRLTFVVTIVIGGIAVGACLAALIPGTVEIATAHHYTVDAGGGAAAALVGAVRPSTGPTASAMGDARARGP